MARYTETVVAAVRQRYEDTDQTIHSIAAEFGIGSRSVSRLAAEHGWAKRSERVRDLPVAMQLLEEAKGLAANPAHSRESGNPDTAEGAAEELGPRLRGDERENACAPNDQTPTPTLPLSGGGSPTAIDRIETLVLKEIEAEETARMQFVGKQSKHLSMRW